MIVNEVMVMLKKIWRKIMSDKKVVSLDQKREETQAEETNTESKNSSEEDSFAEVMRKNEEKRKRLEEERKKANKGVIRSYRLKH